MILRITSMITATGLVWAGTVAVATPPAAALSAGTYIVTTNGSKPALSATGRYVAFLSTAQLTSDDTNSFSDAYVRDVQTGSLTRVSDTRGAIEVDISDDGNRVAFISLPIGGRDEAYVRDLGTGVLTNVTRGPSGQPPDSSLFNIMISGDGSAVAFNTQATTLVPGTGFGHDVFVMRIDTGVVEVASTSAAGVFANGTFNIIPRLSYGGRRVGFVSNSTNLSPADTDTGQDVYVKDLDTGAILVHNLSDRHAVDLTMNADGNRVAFGTSFVSNAFPAGMFVHDFTDDTTITVNPSPCPSVGRPKMDGSGARLAMACGSSPQVLLKEPATSTVVSAQPANSLTAVVSADGQAFAWDDQGTGTSSVRVQRLTNTDDTPPVVAYDLSPVAADGDNGWYRTDVTLTWHVTDPDSAVTTVGCADSTVTTDQPATGYPCTATSEGGTTGPVTATVKRDATPPTVTAAVSPPDPDGAAGWYVTAPSVSFTCDDDTSGVASCPADQQAGERAGAVSGTARDNAGNTAAASTVELRVDLTDPVVTCPATPTFALRSAASLTASVSDGGSGAASTSVTVPVDTSSVGSFTATITGHDVAGRTGAADCGYRVAYVFDGFSAPVDNAGAVNVTNAGAAVPLKWRVLDAAGIPVATVTSVAVTSAVHACNTGAAEDPLEEAATGRSGLQNLGDGYYQFNWSTAKSYAGTCRTLRLNVGDGLLHTAEFRFR